MPKRFSPSSAAPTWWKPPAYPTPHAEQQCKDCGAFGCLIPVPHPAQPKSEDDGQQ